MKSAVILLLVKILLNPKLSNASEDIENTKAISVFDKELYEEILDPELCQRQLEVIRSNTLLWLKFLESGLRVPRSIQMGNLVDLGNYPQCIGIKEDIDEIAIQGKYCTINVPVDQNLTVFSLLPIKPDITVSVRKDDIQKTEHDLISSAFSKFEEITLPLKLAVCIPNACDVKEGLDGLLFNVTNSGLQYEARSCRLPNDKSWVPVDYVAICLYSFIVLLTITSTTYDIYQSIILKSDPKTISSLYRCFSVYTNARRLTTFTKGPGVLECLDGIRTLSMIWLFICHSFFVQPDIINRHDFLNWLFSYRSFYFTSSIMCVDTFLLISGLLVVYTSANKITASKLIRNLPLFYLNRLVRLYPVLATAILLQASIMNRVSDGPQWEPVVIETENCRKNWWVTLLFVQNYIDSVPSKLCVGASWYLAVDMQLYIISPFILFFVLGRTKKVAWSMLIGSLVVILAAATAYIFSLDVIGALFTRKSTPLEEDEYFIKYYVNTLARASPYLIGMMTGYILYLYRDKKIHISKQALVPLWICAFGLMIVCIIANETQKSVDWDNKTINRVVNSLIRPCWAFGVAFVILACVQGYAGPINWFLSLQMWKLLSRLSYAMYLLQMMIMYAMNGSFIAPIYFTQITAIQMTCVQFCITFVAAFLVMLLIDSPLSNLYNFLLRSGPKSSSKETKTKYKLKVK